MTATAKALAAGGLARRPLRVRLHGEPPHIEPAASRRRAPKRSIPEYKAAVAELGAKGPLIIGGKSMGGRVASMVADELYAAGKIAGPALPRLSVPSAGQARAASHQASRRR